MENKCPECNTELEKRVDADDNPYHVCINEDCLVDIIWED